MKTKNLKRKPETQSGGSLKPVGSAWRCADCGRKRRFIGMSRTLPGHESNGRPMVWCDCNLTGHRVSHYATRKPNDKLRHGGE